MPELPLDHDERNTFMRDLDRVSVARLVWRKAPSHACGRSRMMQQLFARG